MEHLLKLLLEESIYIYICYPPPLGTIYIYIWNIFSSSGTAGGFLLVEPEVRFMDGAPMVFVGRVISVEAIEDGTPEDDAWLWQMCCPPLFFVGAECRYTKKYTYL